MTMSDLELLNWARGPGLQIAGIIFIVGMLLRLLEILLLGKKTDLSSARASSAVAGLRTIASRSIPFKGMLSQAAAGYVFHLGFVLVLLFFAPHILLFKDAFALSWPSLPNSLIDAITIVTIAALLFALFARITDPVKRYLSTCGDYLALFVTILPLITGFMAFHRYGLPYTQMLAVHILSVELLLVVMPFTKLTHAVTLVLARYYNGAANGRKGVRV
jgi:nitrate reductase gamma subunit